MRDLSLSIPAGFSKRKTKSSTSTKILNLSMITAIIIFGLLYLFEINALSTKGYQIQNLEQEIRKDLDDQKNLQVQTSNMQSIDSIQSQAQKLNFVPVTNVTYLKDGNFALR
jgi:cell division protein FtsL